MRPTRAWLVVLIAIACSSPPARRGERAAPASSARAVIRTCVAFQTGPLTRAPVGDAPAPAARQDPPAPSSGALAKSEIRRVIRERLPEVRRCYENELVNRPGLTGMTMAHFTINPDGAVSRSTAGGFDPAVDGCVAKVMATLRFPATGGFINVNYPFIFKEAEGKPVARIPGASREREIDMFDWVSKPGCRAVVPPAPLIAAQTALDGCAREAGAQLSRVDLVVVLKSTATVTGPERLRGCVDRELAGIAPVAPATSCTIAMGDPAAMAGELPAIGSETACPAALR